MNVMKATKNGPGNDPLAHIRLGSGARLYEGPDLKLFILVGCDQSGVQLCLLQIFSGGVGHPRDLQLSRNTLFPSCPRLCFIIVTHRDLVVYRDDSLTSLMVIMRTEQPTKCFEPLQRLMQTVGAVKSIKASRPSNELLTAPRRSFCCGSLLSPVRLMYVQIIFVRFRWHSDHLSEIAAHSVDGMFSKLY